MFQHFQFNTAMLTIIHKVCLLRIINCLPFARIYVHPQVFGGSLSCSSSQFFGGSLSCSSSQFFWRESELLVISVFWRESGLLIVSVFLWESELLVVSVFWWESELLIVPSFLAGVWVVHRLSFLCCVIFVLFAFALCLVHNVACVSGLSILYFNFPFSFLWRLFICHLGLAYGF